MECAVVNVVFAYRAVFTMPRRRKPESGYFRGVSPIAITALDAAEAPVVCRVRNHRNVRDPDEAYDHSIRFYDGRYWRPSTPDHDRSPISLDRLRQLISAPADEQVTWDTNPFLEIADPQLDPPRDYARRTSTGSWLCGLKTIEETGVRQIHSSGLDDGIARLNAASDGFRLIDGILYQSCLEPRLVVSIRHSHLEFEVVTEGEPDDGWVVEIFRPDRLADARQFAAFLVKDQGIRHIGTSPRIEVPRPDLLQRADLDDLARRHAPGLLKHIRPLVAHLPDEALSAFAAMRRSGQALLNGAAGEAEAFLESLAKVSAGLTEAAAVEDNDVPYGQADSFARAARLPLERWTRFEGGKLIVPMSAADADALDTLGSAP